MRKGLTRYCILLLISDLTENLLPGTIVVQSNNDFINLSEDTGVDHLRMLNTEVDDSNTTTPQEGDKKPEEENPEETE